MAGLQEAWTALKCDKNSYQRYEETAKERNTAELTLTEKQRELKVSKIFKEMQRYVSCFQVYVDNLALLSGAPAAF